MQEDGKEAAGFLDAFLCLATAICVMAALFALVILYGYIYNLFADFPEFFRGPLAAICLIAFIVTFLFLVYFGLIRFENIIKKLGSSSAKDSTLDDQEYKTHSTKTSEVDYTEMYSKAEKLWEEAFQNDGKFTSSDRFSRRQASGTNNQEHSRYSDTATDGDCYSEAEEIWEEAFQDDDKSTSQNSSSQNQSSESGCEDNEAKDKENPESSKRNQLIDFFGQLLGKLAKADGRVDSREIESAERTFKRMNFSESDRQVAIKAFNEAKDSTSTIIEIGRALACFVSGDTFRFLYDQLWDLAKADGTLSWQERDQLQKLAEVFGCKELFEDNYRAYNGWESWSHGRCFHEGEAQRRSREREEKRQREEEERSRQKAREEERRKAEETRRREEERRRLNELLAKEYSILQVDCEATDDEVRSAWRKMVMKWHPDKLRADELPEELVRIATDKTTAINMAWEKIRRFRRI